MAFGMEQYDKAHVLYKDKAHNMKLHHVDGEVNLNCKQTFDHWPVPGKYCPKKAEIKIHGVFRYQGFFRLFPNHEESDQTVAIKKIGYVE